MITMYEPCSNCNHKQCERCTHHALQVNYKRALKRIVELSPEPITIIHHQGANHNDTLST